jgi:hypothetical protein
MSNLKFSPNRFSTPSNRLNSKHFVNILDGHCAIIYQPHEKKELAKINFFSTLLRAPASTIEISEQEVYKFVTDYMSTLLSNYIHNRWTR